MKRKFPFGCLIVVLLVTLVYALRFSFVSECQDILRTQSISGKELINEDIPIQTEMVIEEVNNEQQESGKAHWWKAGITEYELMEEIMTEPVEIETMVTQDEIVTTSESEETTATTQATTTEPPVTTEQTIEQTTEVTTQETTETTETTETIETTEGTTQIEQPPPSPSNSWGTLTVYDIKTGKVVTDSAYNIICQVVHNEIGSTMQNETIKAQALAAYSFIKFYNNRGTTPKLALKPYPSQKIKDCVSAISGLGIYYNGNIALTTFCASTAGYTANSKDVWGTTYPYLVSVESKYDNQDMNYGRTITYSESVVKSKLESYCGISLSSNPQNWISIQSRLSGNMVGTISIDGQTTTTGRRLRENVLGLRSASFDISYSNGTFTFTTYGYGHGVGMPQNGANLYAYYEGWNYEQILKHYYTGVEIK